MAFVKDMEISNSTFYSHLQSGNRFIRHSCKCAECTGVVNRKHEILE